ncbi:hypothetical protein [Sphingobium boeckii]|uniref:Uncharacterized protein n=1 Tax=Sphingobium boeckii TaxID=1082345 RepID=A0A7W9AL16_9SPHN|nr:hypothetical protein [Sphingobium boeckii]MBB5687478.1 hypothetical protein [Sphingobium boeckii]
MLTSCSSENPPTNVVVDSNEKTAEMLPVQDQHNYIEREKYTYFYATAISEEDRKQGKVVGKILAFQYLGLRNGTHNLASLDDQGRRLYTSECSVPCRVIKNNAGGRIDRTPYEPDSVIGSAFEDAINGRLEVWKNDIQNQLKNKNRYVQLLPQSLPVAFLGEWNTNLQDCGTGRNESRLVIAPDKLQFYESDANVKSIKIHSSRSITIEASFSGEGELWNDTFEMVLSRSGDDLTIEDNTRHKCN